MSNKKECIRFEKLPKNIDELKLMAQDCFESPFKMAALSVAVFCNYENDVDSTIEMLNYIKGPRELSPYDIQFIRDRLKGMGYVVRSYIKGSSPDNDYAISAPYEIEVEDTEDTEQVIQAVTLLKKEGYDARVYVSGGTMHGYVFAKGEAFQKVAKILEQVERVNLNEEPVNKSLAESIKKHS